MSMRTKQTRPERCYCRIQGDKDLNEIAKIITVLNCKIVRLRNEVTALKNGNPIKEKLFENSGDDHQHLCSRCCEKEFSKSVIPEESKALTHFLKNNLKKTEKDIPKDVSNVINLNLNEKAQTNSKPIFEKILKRKKISRGVQCNSEMERKRKHFLKCFKKELNAKEEYLWEPNKKPRFSSTINFCQDSEHEANNPNYMNAKRRKGEQLCQFCETYAHDEKLQEIKPSISRMVGGAEVRGHRLISDFGNKMQKINFYKNAKFNARNVKKRLDACIVELNEIIEDVSLILPKTDICKE